MKRPLLVTSPLALALAPVAMSACQPTFDEDPSRIEGPRVLAVTVTPPDVRQGERVTVTAVLTDGATITASPAGLDWAYCHERKPLADPSPLAPACLAVTGARVAFGGGEPAPAFVVPADACRLFGPDRPPPKPGEPAARPADPDSTGGFYLPGQVRSPGAAEAIFSVRLRCGVPSATQEQYADFEQRYRPNENPAFALAAVTATGDVPVDGDVLEIDGARVELHVTWSDCAGGAPCDGAEPYLAFDPRARQLVERREALQVTWLTTRGSFGTSRTGRPEGDLAHDTTNTLDLHAETEAAIAVVLRDDRGGAAFRTVRVRRR